MKKILLSILVFTTLLSCQTQEQIRREQMVDNLSTQVVQSQKLAADFSIKMQELEKTIAELTGRLEETSQASHLSYKERIEDLANKMEILEASNLENIEKVSRLETKIDDQTKFIEQVTSTLKKMTSVPAPKKSSPRSKKSEYDQAMDLYVKGKHSQAKVILSKLSSSKKFKGNKRARILHNLGMSAYILKNYDDALVSFSKLYTEFPKSNYNARGLYFMGQSFQKKGSKDEAQGSYSELIKSFPKSDYASKAKKLVKN